MAYKLQLREGVGIHPVFYVSQLKKHIDPNAVPNPDLPMVGENGKVKTVPILVLETRSNPRNQQLITPWLVQWEGLAPEDATWEDADFIKETFPDFYQSTIRGWFPESNP